VGFWLAVYDSNFRGFDFIHNLARKTVAKSKKKKINKRKANFEKAK